MDSECAHSLFDHSGGVAPTSASMRGDDRRVQREARDHGRRGEGAGAAVIMGVVGRSVGDGIGVVVLLVEPRGTRAGDVCGTAAVGVPVGEGMGFGVSMGVGVGVGVASYDGARGGAVGLRRPE